MKLETKKMPKLRFREFSGEWQEKKFDDLFKNIGGTGLENQVVENGTHKFISIGNYSKDGKYIDNGQRIELNTKTKEKLLDKDNLVMVLNDKTTAGDLIGSSILIDRDDTYIYNQRSERLICDSKIMPKYAWIVLNSHSFRKKVYKISQGGTQIYVNFPSVKKLNIDLPELEEQKKIARFLGVVDEKIERLQGKKKLLEKYKKGAMQAIFSQKIRFNDENGKVYPGWEEKNLGQIVSITTGKKDVNAGNPKGGYPFYTCAKNHTYSDQYSFDGEAILIAGNAEVGLCQYYKGKFEAYQRTYVLQDFETNGQYLFKYLSHYFRKYALGLKQTGAMSFIKIGMLDSFRVPVPSKEEQQKISNFLTSLDGKIKLQESKLEQAKQFKKALLQQMFV